MWIVLEGCGGGIGDVRWYYKFSFLKFIFLLECYIFTLDGEVVSEEIQVNNNKKRDIKNCVIDEY